MSHPYDCIVLGAGIAGVTAARNILEKVRTLPGAVGKVLLLEGTDRIGGRMLSLTSFVRNAAFAAGSHPVEAGAEYIHITEDSRNRKFFDELRRHGFDTKRFAKWGTPPIIEPGMNRITFPDWERPRPLVDAILHDCRLYAVEELFDEIRDVKKDVAAGKFVKSQNYDGHRARALGRYAISSHAPGVLDDDEDTLSVAGLKADRIPHQLDDPAEYKLTDSSGAIIAYASLPEAIEREFSAPGGGGETRKLRRVTGVRRLPGDGVEVTATNEASGAVETFTAGAAVCTFSVGMLAAQGAAIFGEMFPEKKTDALEVVRMGPITKFSIEFKERFWDREMTVLSNPEGKARTFFAAFPDSDGPHVITGLLMGSDHKAITALGDKQALDWVFKEIQKVFNPDFDDSPWTLAEKVVPDPANPAVPWSFHRQEWSDGPRRSDEFALGGNSFIRYQSPSFTPAMARAARDALKDPLESLPVFWAGEATAPAYDRDYQPLAVHGAYISGVRVADDVFLYLDLAVRQGDEAAFRAEYKKKYKPKAEKAKALKVEFKIAGNEHEILRYHARRRSDEAANKSAKTIVRRVLKRQGSSSESGLDPIDVPDPDSPETRRVQFKLEGRAAERLGEYAGANSGGITNDAAKTILREELYRIAERL
jgi:hypothetical protein